jgi:DNA-binding NarL/FixJ family response regulator
MMIVDDSSIIRRNLGECLRRLGHQVVAEMEDAEEAVEFYKNNEVDLVTMDIQLPGMNGIEAVRRIREHDAEALIVMISSVEQREMVYEAIKLGAKHYVVKPFTDEKVGSVIDSVLVKKFGPSALLRKSSTPAKIATSDEASDRPKKKEPPKLDVPPSGALPFELVMRDKIATLTVQRHVNDNNLRYFLGCLQGLLYFRNVKYVIEFWEPLRHETAERLLLDFVKEVRGRKGTVGIVTDNATDHVFWTSKLVHGVYRKFAEIDW